MTSKTTCPTCFSCLPSIENKGKVLAISSISIALFIIGSLGAARILPIYAATAFAPGVLGIVISIKLGKNKIEDSLPIKEISVQTTTFSSLSLKEKLNKLRETHLPPKLTSEEKQKAKEVIERCAAFAFADPKISSRFNKQPELAVKPLLNLTEFYELFLPNPDLLARYLEETISAMLNSSLKKEEVQDFKILSKCVRAIWLFLISKNENEDFKKYYHYRLKEPDLGRTNIFKYFQLKSIPAETLNDLGRFHVFKFLIISGDFYKIYRLRVNQHKLSEKCEISSKKILQIIQGVWFHGTTALKALKNSECTMIPTGWLFDCGLTPAYGELGTGIQTRGVNQHKLSGTPLEFSREANKYANMFEPEFNIEMEKKVLGSLLAWEPGLNDLERSFGTNLGRRYISCVRLLKWGPEIFEKGFSVECEGKSYQVSLAAVKEKAKQVLRFVETTKENSRNRYYFFSPKRRLADHESTSLNDLAFFSKKILELTPQSFPPYTEEEKSNFLKPFPVVLASMNHLGTGARFGEINWEHNISGELRLGQDIQLIFTAKENVASTEEWIKTDLPKEVAEKMTVFTFEDLEEAEEEYSTKVIPYVDDLLSIKRLNNL